MMLPWFDYDHHLLLLWDRVPLVGFGGGTDEMAFHQARPVTNHEANE